MKKSWKALAVIAVAGAIAFAPLATAGAMADDGGVPACEASNSCYAPGQPPNSTPHPPIPPDAGPLAVTGSEVDYLPWAGGAAAVLIAGVSLMVVRRVRA